MARAPKATENETIDHVTGEVTTNLPAPIATVEFGRGLPSGMKVAKYVSVPMLEVPPGQSFICAMVDKVRVLPPLKDAEGNPIKSKIKGDHHASTIRSNTGEARLFTWTTVFKSEMERHYPGDSYLGKWFQITRLPIKRGKDYATYAITELEMERDAA